MLFTASTARQSREVEAARGQRHIAAWLAQDVDTLQGRAYLSRAASWMEYAAARTGPAAWRASRAVLGR
jgi:hypothetical protein